MKAVADGLYAKLNGDSTLLALVSGIFRNIAPENQTFPYVIFSKQSGVFAYTLPVRAWRDYLWLIKVVDQNTSAATAYTADERCDTLLTDQALSLSGVTQMYLRRESDVEYTEQEDGLTYQHVGGIYRVWVR